MNNNDQLNELFKTILGAAEESVKQSANQKKETYRGLAKELKTLYDALIQEGFTKDEAFVLLNTMLENVCKTTKF